MSFFKNIQISLFDVISEETVNSEQAAAMLGISRKLFSSVRAKVCRFPSPVSYSLGRKGCLFSKFAVEQYAHQYGASEFFAANADYHRLYFREQNVMPRKTINTKEPVFDPVFDHGRIVFVRRDA